MKYVPLTVSSHPNFGLGPLKEAPIMRHNHISVMVINLGPFEDTLVARFSENKELVIDYNGGMVLRCRYNVLQKYNWLGFSKDDCEQPRLGQQFQVNKNGSISPIEAPHLSLGILGTDIPDNLAPVLRKEAYRIAREAFEPISSDKEEGSKPLQSCDNFMEQYIDVDVLDQSIQHAKELISH
eukprot:CAMPEP_0113302862 /NCGR_PEP_ID=MMETSP0010_2-20120614/3513_1 /TAXON_ID=216773 ORGANISM="Corethron hystrix, Strain 308" /NCGR_SAMPLE_ID=MMETSP0010_2 /ASSEMBLY_ACC=CAM_ASM_000155 /LENGTH=181 /DNA_ID=CAMNT_0000156753 /DNA_START=640 /DNA_END=1182 /DNA_ORIENTATION=+ /assembly_acc=CAM_ASM_000155